MKKLLSTLVILIWFTDPNIKAQPAILFNSKAVLDTQGKESLVIKRLRVSLFRNIDSVYFIDKNKVKRAISKNDIWGYKDKVGTLYRCYEKSYYEIDFIDLIVRYRQTGRFTHLFFSENLDSPIYPYSKKQMKAHLPAELCQKIFANKKYTKSL